jgi:hypothetical protein
MSWLLDTDVIFQPAKRHGDVRVITWLELAKRHWCVLLGSNFAIGALPAQPDEQMCALSAFLRGVAPHVRNRTVGRDLRRGLCGSMWAVPSPLQSDCFTISS